MKKIINFLKRQFRQERQFRPICSELVSVTPLNKPTGILFYLDFIYKQKETLRVGKINKN